MTFVFPFSWECHHPNWLSYVSEGLKLTFICFRGVGIPPTRPHLDEHPQMKASYTRDKKPVDSMGELCHYHVIDSWLLMKIQLSRHLDILYLHVDGSIPMFQFSPSEAYAKRKCTWLHRPDFIFLWKYHITTASFCCSSWQLYCDRKNNVGSITYRFHPYGSTTQL